MADLQRRVDLAFAKLDIIEEMLRPLVAAKEIHERGHCASAFPLERVSSNPTASLARERKDSIAIRAQQMLAHPLNATPLALGRILQEAKD